MQKNSNISVFLLLTIHFCLTLLTFVVWESKQHYSVTGDEPHYLVMASGIIRHGQLEQTIPYQEEFKTKAIYKSGLAPADAIPSPQNTHTVQGPHGLYNVHNVGLPLLLAVPFLLGGVIGAKIFMILASGLGVVLAWKISALFSQQTNNRFWAVVAVAVALPLLPASNQIFPDLLAGLLALTGIYWLFTMEKQRYFLMECLLMTAVAFLPWLQIKFGLTAALLGMGILYAHYRANHHLARLTGLSLVALGSMILLIAYNWHAFGNPFGPYSLPPYNERNVEFNLTALMVFFGLFLDQNHGLLFQNPIMFVGIFALGSFFRTYTYNSLLWLLVFLSLLIPNALHPSWYGAESFSGRFMWSAAMVFLLPTLFSLLKLSVNHRHLFRFLVISSILLQSWLYVTYTFHSDTTNLYNRVHLWIFSYPIFYPDIYDFLPVLYDISNVWKTGVNYSWLLVTFSLLSTGILTAYKPIRIKKWHGLAIFGMTILIIIAGKYIPLPTSHHMTFTADTLPSNTGVMQENIRTATAGIDPPGYLSFGPYIPLPEGVYTATIAYQSSAQPTTIVGKTDIYSNDIGTILLETFLTGTKEKPVMMTLTFTVSPTQRGKKYEIRNYWNGVADISITELTLIKQE